MKLFTGLEYLKIDIANASGKDKLLFEDRIKWFDNNISDEVVTMDNKELLDFVNSFNPDEIESKELLYTGLLAYKDYWFGRPSGYMCQLDAISSGASIMSCLMADKKGLENTGLLGNKRSDLYTAVYETMKRIYRLPLSYKRSDIKQAVMCFLYGSKAEPEKVFNKQEDVLEAFWQAVAVEAKGAYELQQVLTNNWNSQATYHQWILPDGFTAHIPVLVERKHTYTIEEEGETFNIDYVVKVEGTKKHAVSNCANAIHSVDGMLVREMARRCMFNQEHIQEVLWYLINTKDELYEPLDIDDLDKLGTLGELIYMYEQSKFCSVRIVDEIKSQADTYKLSKEHRTKLIDILTKMNQQGYIEMVFIHDCAKTLPNQMNYIRYWYKEMCADIVESNMLCFLYNQITSEQLTSDIASKEYRKQVANQVRQSNYGLS